MSLTRIHPKVKIKSISPTGFAQGRSPTQGLINAVANKVEALLKNATKNIDENSLIKPIAPNYPFSSNGVYFFVGRMGTGKTYEIWRHIQ
jgi:hypothetical protein